MPEILILYYGKGFLMNRIKIELLYNEKSGFDGRDPDLHLLNQFYCRGKCRRHNSFSIARYLLAYFLL